MVVGADWGEVASVSSRKGFVDVGRPPELKEFADGDRARFLKGLLEPRLIGICGEACRSKGELVNAATKLWESIKI